MAAGESENPQENAPRAIRQVFWRILLFYVLAIIVIGFLVPAIPIRNCCAQTWPILPSARSRWCSSMPACCRLPRYECRDPDLGAAVGW